MSLTLLVGPTAVGKSVVWEMLVRNHKLLPFKTYTSRKPRHNETGNNVIPQYHFLSKEQFQSNIEAGHFFEHIEHVGNLYGTSKKDIKSCIEDSNNHWVGIVEIKGALEIKKIFPEVLTIFMLPPTIKDLKKRILGRNSETTREIEERLRIALEEEIPQSNLLDKTVVNESIKETSKEVINIIRTHFD